jgi:predicted DNA-binding transcriptional regulator YafY
MSKALRLLYILQSIPRAPQKISSRQLHERLQQNNFVIDLRSVQRDLNELSTLFPDLQNDNCKVEIGWRWTKESKIQQIPAIDPSMALTFKLVDQFLSELVPQSVKAILKPYFDSSDDVLNALGTDKMATWSDKVRILPRTQPLIPAAINEEVLTTVYQGLFEGKQIQATYRRGYDEEIRDYVLNPLGLVFRENAIYLVANLKKDYAPLHYALHRFTDCELLGSPVETSDDFKLDDVIKSGSFEYAEIEGKMLSLTVIVDPTVAKHLSESPLSDDQTMTEGIDERIKVSATVKDTRQLKWWLLGFGDQVEVIKPKRLRDEFIEIGNSLVNRYS